jgi:hypothetical protein
MSSTDIMFLNNSKTVLQRMDNFLKHVCLSDNFCVNFHICV